MEIAGSRYGPAARDIVHKLFLLGHTSLSELAAAYESKNQDHVNGNTGSSSAFSNGVNGHTASPIDSVGHLHTVVNKLLETGFVEPVAQSMFRSPTDTYNMIEREILQESFGGSTKGAKQKEDLKGRVNSRFSNIKAERNWKGQAKKRHLNGDHNGINGTNKRRRLDNGSSTDSGDHFLEDDGTRLDVGFSSC